MSRLVGRRAYCRRRDDTFYDGPLLPPGSGSDTPRRRSLSLSDVFLWVLTALYRASKRLDATYWLMAIEESLQRILVGYGLPLRAVGPKSDYFGPVTPYVIDLAEPTPPPDPRSPRSPVAPGLLPAHPLTGPLVHIAEGPR